MDPLTSPQADVLIVGGGIAGWSAAYFATRRGRRVTLIDEGVHRASDLPVALVNPLRGHAGRLVPRGVDGMHATFALIDRLRGEGHAIAAGRGLHRPLVDLPGEMRTPAYWGTRIGGRIDFEFIDESPMELGFAERPPALHLQDAGWVAAPDLLAALRAASGIAPIAGRVRSVACDAAKLDDGAVLHARVVLWCGGAWGAYGLDGKTTSDGDGIASATPLEPAIYKPGSLAVTAAPITAAPMTFGLYAAPWNGRTLIGPTREDANSAFAIDETPGDAIARLQDRARRLFGGNVALTPAWRGVRLARLSSTARDALHGVASLTALGSRGYLIAPLLASEWAASL